MPRIFGFSFGSRAVEQSSEQQPELTVGQLKDNITGAYTRNVEPINNLVKKQATATFGESFGEVAETAFRVVPVVLLLVFLPAQTPLVTFAIIFTARELLPKSLKDHETFFGVVADAIGFHSAANGIYYAFSAASDPISCIAMVVHLGIAHGCFSFKKELQNKEGEVKELPAKKGPTQDRSSKKAVDVDSADEKCKAAETGPNAVFDPAEVGQVEETNGHGALGGTYRVVDRPGTPSNPATPTQLTRSMSKSSNSGRSAQTPTSSFARSPQLNFEGNYNN